MKQGSIYVLPRLLSEEHETLKFTSHSSVGSKLCHTCDFLHWNAFLALCTAGLKFNRKLSAHLFEVGSWITLASLHRLCALLWIMSLSVYVCVVRCLLFLFFSYNGLYCQGQRNVTSATGFHQATAQCFRAWVLIPVTPFTSQLLCLCSQQHDIKPRLQFAQWQTTQNACLLVWHLTVLDTWVGSIIKVMKSKRKGLFTYVLLKPPLFVLIYCKLFCFDAANRNDSGG